MAPRIVQSTRRTSTFRRVVKIFVYSEIRLFTVILTDYSAKKQKKTDLKTIKVLSLFQNTVNALQRIINYSSLIAEAGHSEAHVPQLRHLEASISLCPLFSEIAPAGQSGSHVPQFTHTPASIL